MPLAITDDHRALAQVARDLLSDRDARGATRAALDGAAPHEVKDLWPDVVAAGWPSLAADFGLAEAAVVSEEIGRAAAPVSLIACSVAALLGREATALGLDSHVVVGPGPHALVLDGDDVVVSDSPGEPLEAADPSRPLRSWHLGGERIAGAARLARRTALVLAAAEAAGGAQACVEASTAYARQREQFGRPIGSFQAVKHLCADSLVDAELAVAAVWDATRGAAGDDEADLIAEVAALVALPAFVRCAHRMIQVHGGLGFTWEHDSHLLLRRALSLQALYAGSATRVAELVAAGVHRGLDLELPAGAEVHRTEARAFAEGGHHDQTAWARGGWLLPHLPPPFGRGADAVAQLVISQELAGLPRPHLGLGEWLIPTVLAVATPEQVERWIWPSLEGRLRWCQLFSEPGAGSDAAAITTRATRVDGGWRLDGTKVWTSAAQDCHLGLATVRTDATGERHAGITMVVVDLTAPGVVIRPLREMTGRSLFNEVALEGVAITDGDVVGEVGDGWQVARSTLGNERVSISGSGQVTMSARDLLGLAGPCVEIGELVAEGQALRALGLRQAARAVAGSGAGAEGMVAKLVMAEHAQRVTEAGLRLVGPQAVTGEQPTLLHDHLYARCLTIAGGTSEILRTTIAERVLGLPREPRHG